MLFSRLISFYRFYNLPYDLAEVLAFITVFLLVSIVAVSMNFLLKKFIGSIVQRLLTRYINSAISRQLIKHGVFMRLSHLAPAAFIYAISPMLIKSSYQWSNEFVYIVGVITVIYFAWAFVTFLMTFLDAFHDYYRQTKSIDHPSIKSYIQVVKIFIWSFATIFILSIILNRSPTVLLTGFGAASAIILLIFKDSILGLISSIQISVYDLFRVGDWITMPDERVDGLIEDINVNSVKVRNFDNTFTTLPTSRLVSANVQNWRGLREMGSRRIKRSIAIDMDTIKYCDDALLERLQNIDYLKTYIAQKKQAFASDDASDQINQHYAAINQLSLTNIGLFRVYMENLLKNTQTIIQQPNFLIRELPPSEIGLPLEIYVFTEELRWEQYESLQADLFDHLIASLALFDLKPYQRISSGHDH